MISVITITHNRLEFLKKCIYSVQAQNNTDYEHIIVDDGSNDGTREFVLGLNDNRIKYISLNRIGHIPTLRNIGLDNATGNICSFLDNDDVWGEQYLQCVNEVMQTGNYESVLLNANIVTPNNSQVLFHKGLNLKMAGNLLRQKLLNDKFVIYTSCFSFRITADRRFNEKLKFGDNDLFVKILAQGNTLVVSEPHVNIIKHDSNTSSLKTYESPFIQCYFEEFVSLDYLKKTGAINPFLYRQSYSTYAYKLGKNLQQLDRIKEAKKYFMRAFLIYPLNIKAIFKFFSF